MKNRRRHGFVRKEFDVENKVTRQYIENLSDALGRRTVDDVIIIGSKDFFTYSLADESIVNFSVDGLKEFIKAAQKWLKERKPT